jgi:hypothetical protein
VLAGKNADAHRGDLFDAISSGSFPEWELAVQIIDEDQALAFGFDVLDSTKIIPEELAPLKKLGVLQLNANPTNYFAETEQVMVSHFQFRQVRLSISKSRIRWPVMGTWTPLGPFHYLFGMILYMFVKGGEVTQSASQAHTRQYCL